MISRAALLALLWIPAAGLASAQTPAFRAGISLVRLDALAIDGGVPIANLRADDFEVSDNGAPQPIQSLFADSQPLDVLFLFDCSRSVQGETLARLVDASHVVLRQLNAEDRVGLMTFGTSFHLVTPPTADRALVGEAIEHLEPGGATALFDALYAALTLAENQDRRVLILVFTDGWDNLSWVPARAALDLARRSEAVVYAVASKPAGAPGPDEDLLRELTGATGGRVVTTEGSQRLQAVFLEVLREMRARYILTYGLPPASAPGWHAVSVRLKHRKGKVVTRGGYLLQPDRTMP